MVYFNFFLHFLIADRGRFSFAGGRKKALIFAIHWGVPKKARNIFSFKKYHLPALKVFLLIAVGIVHNESCYKDLRSHGMDLFDNSQTEILCMPRKSMTKRFLE